MSRFGYVTGGYTPLMIAAEEGNLARVKQFIGKADLNQKNDGGFTALAVAVRAGSTAIASYLLAKGADPNAKNNSGQSVLFLASWYALEPIVKILLAKHCEVDAADSRGWTPLMIAVYHSHATIIKLLLEAGASPSIKDTFGKTPIARAKTPEITALLKQYAAPPPKKPPVVARSASASRIQTKSPPPTRHSKMTSPYSSISYTPVARSHSGRLKDELDRHLQASALTLVSRNAEATLAHISRSIQSELARVYDKLHQQAYQKMSDTLVTQYESAAERLVNVVDQGCINLGYAVPEEKNIPKFIVPTRTKRGMPRLKLPPAQKVYEELARLQLPLSKETDEQVKEYVEELTAKLEHLGDKKVCAVVEASLKQVIQYIGQEMGAIMRQLSSSMSAELESLMKKRHEEILVMNSEVPTQTQSKMPRLNLDAIK